MRHRKNTVKLGRTGSHRRCLWANMLKDLIDHGRIVTTVAKAKVLRSHADKMITLAKENTLASRRRAIGKLMVTFNALSDKDARALKGGATHVCNVDRRVINKLFGELGPRFGTREGGYTRIIKSTHRIGDNAQTCVVEYLED